MPCCGKARAQAQRAISHPTARPAPTAAPQRQPQRPAQPPAQLRPQPKDQPSAAQNAYFSYLGSTGLTVVGPVSSQVYRFVPSGPPIVVDPRDAASLARVPNLRRIQHV
jgi:hypothetical protein